MMHMVEEKVLVPITHATRFMISPLYTSLVTCVNKEGKPNIITISLILKAWGMPLRESEPPFGVFFIMVHPSRYSYKLIEETGDFVINVPTIDMVEQVWYCGTKSGRAFDKFKETRLTPAPARYVKSPLIAECPINIECKVVEKIKPKHSAYTFFFGKALAIHAKEGIWDGNILNIDKCPVPFDVPAGKMKEHEFRAPGKVILRCKELYE